MSPNAPLIDCLITARSWVTDTVECLPGSSAISIPERPASSYKLSQSTNNIKCTLKFESTEVLAPQYRFQLGIQLLPQEPEA